MITPQSIFGGMIGLCVFLLIGTMGWLIYVCSWEMGATKTSGTVVAVHQRRLGEDRLYFPVVEYSDTTGSSHRYEPSAGSNPAREKSGEKVVVFYRISSPDDALIEDKFLFWYLPFGAGTFAIAAIVGLSWLMKKIDEPSIPA